MDLTPDDYYANMYDIEQLTDLNRKRTPTTKKHIQEVEELITNNQCTLAEEKINFLLQKHDDVELHILKGALAMKNLVLIGKEESPKHAAITELVAYTRRDTQAIEKEMMVEKPVDEAWKTIRPNPLSEEEVTKFYVETDAYIYELMAANHIVQTLYSYAVLLQKLKNKKLGKILDYGAGAGTLCILFKQLGNEIIYADLPGKLFDFAKWRFEKRNLAVPMLNLQEEQPGKVDTIISTEVVEHVVDPVGMLKKFHILLSPKGILIVSESCNYIEDFSSHLPQNKKYGGNNFIALMEEIGFKQILPNPYIPQLLFEKC